MILIYGNMIESTTMSYTIQKQRLEDELKTNIEIVNITFDNTTNPHTTTMFVKNIGQNKIDIDYVDVFIDEVRLERNGSNRSIEFAEESVTINPLHWDSDEYIKIEVYLNLTNVTRLATVSVAGGVTDTMTFLG